MLRFMSHGLAVLRWKALVIKESQSQHDRDIRQKKYQISI